MRHPTCFQRRYEKQALQFGLRWILVAITLFAVLFALQEFFLGGLLIAVLALSLFFDGLASWWFQPFGRQTLAVRKYWISGPSPSGVSYIAGPLLPVVWYLVLTEVCHAYFNFYLVGTGTWDLSLPIGITLRTLDHTVNGAFIAYLLAVLIGILSPLRRYRLIDVITAAMAMIGLIAMSYIIASV